jgi:hypothetical protein
LSFSPIRQNRQAKATFAVGPTSLVIVWQSLVNDCDYTDLGVGCFARHNDAEARKRYLVRQLESSVTA